MISNESDNLDEPFVDNPTPVANVKRSPFAKIATAVVVIGTTGFVLAQLKLNLIFGPNLDVGGDNAAHVVAVSYFIHHLLAHGKLSGWDPQWFDGFPLYVFYFPLPAVLIALVGLVFPYAVAFKVITVLGIALLPVSAYLFGHLAGFARPIPALMSAAMLPFIFSPFYPYQIDGGNLASTLAGEFSFTLALAVALIFLGVVCYAMRTGKLRWLAAILFAATMLCHVVPAFFAAIGAIVFFALRPGKYRARVLIQVGVVGVALCAFWLLPFAVDLPFSSSMGYLPVGLGQSLLPLTAELMLQVLALVGAVIALFTRDREATGIAILALISFLAFTFLKSGLIYNARWVPFWFVTTDLLAAYAVGKTLSATFHFLGHAEFTASIGALLGGLISVGACAFYLGVFPFVTTPASMLSFLPYWLSWNYSGYQGKSGWPEFQRLVNMVDTAAQKYGCGRLDYEYSANIELSFGSTLVPMSFPYWTDGCVDSTEGVYYESSTSTPFHFLDQAQLSVEPSNPMVGIPYRTLNVPDGIRHLQLSGVKYFLANSPTVEQAASADPELSEIASMPETPSLVDGGPPVSGTATWILYEIHNAPLVVGLTRQPVVESGLSTSAWQYTAIEWYQNEQFWPLVIARAGPSTWKRVQNGALVAPNNSPQLPRVVISKTRTTDSSISFTVSRIGVPVLVKIPYFPNWHAVGANGPYESTPNLMIVVPSSRNVTLTYGTTTTDTVAKAISLAGLVGLLGLVRSGPNSASGVGDQTTNTGDTPSPLPEPDGDTSGGLPDALSVDDSVQDTRSADDPIVDP